MQVTIKNVDENVFREFKAAAVQKGVKLGTALTLAMKKFKDELVRKRRKFTDLKPRDWGSDTEHLSEDIDKILYGG